jgi:hypothetical protein
MAIKILKMITPKNSNMKKNMFKYIIPGILLISMAACKKNNFVVDRDPLIAPEAARFIITPPVSNNYYRYFIQDNPAPGSTYSLPVGITTVSGAERKVKFTYTSWGAVAGVQYTVPAEITIPAGSATGTLTVQGLFAGYPTGRKDTVKIKIASGDGYVKPNAYQDSVMLIMQKYCNVVLANLGGDYTRTYENGTYGPYTSSVINLTSTGATKATATLTNIYDSNISATIGLDWTDPGAFKVTMAAQQTQYTSGGLPLFVRANPSSTSTFSSCDNTFTLYLQLYTTAGVYDSWTMTMAR